MSPFDIWDTIASQYANSPILTQIIEDAAANLTANGLFQAFFDDIWNIETASTYGLDIWGRIVGIDRHLYIPTTSYFGFAEASATSFGSDTNIGAPFGDLEEKTKNYAMSNDLYRRAILAKAASNITSGGIQDINRILMLLFYTDGFPPAGNAYVIEPNDTAAVFRFDETGVGTTFGEGVFADLINLQGPMNIIYQFDFALTTAEYALITQGNVLPKPAGVNVTINAQVFEGVEPLYTSEGVPFYVSGGIFYVHD